MKRIASVLLVAWLGAGCMTSTVAKRKEEKPAAYAALSPEMRALVDQSQIKVGMPTDAVYIAWGQPSQVISTESSSGAATTWIYIGTAWNEYRFWNYNYYPYYPRGRYYYSYPHMTYLDYSYAPYSYPAAEVFFENDVVKNWRHVTPPPRY